MSYLDYPRLHFSGEFLADPSTPNNDAANYGRAAPVVQWNAEGAHWFQLQGCKIRMVVDKTSAPKTAAAQDALVDGTVETTNSPGIAKLVDLDPSHQTGSQVWGAEFKVKQAGSNSGFTAKLQTATLRDLWAARVPGKGFPDGFGGCYQSVLTGVNWDLASASPVLKDLNALSAAKLSIKFVVYAFVLSPPNSHAHKGRIVGSIGPVLAGEPDHFLSTRRMDTGSALFNPNPAAMGAAFGAVPFKIDTARGKIIVDLGNAIPETAAAGARINQGTLNVVLMSAPPKDLGPIAYDKARFETTAGIEDVPFAGPALAAAMNVNRLALKRSAPASQLILTERTLLVDAAETVFRMNPGETRNVEITVKQLGFAKAGQKLAFDVTGAPASGLTVPASVTTAAGKATLTLTAADPGNPRGALDGQVYTVGVFLNTVSPSNKRLELKVRVFDKVAVPANPTFAAHVKPILEPYARLYPFMKRILDLADPAAIRTYVNNQADADRKKMFMDVPDTDPRLMPVTRDLSRDKKAIVLKWIANGMP